MSPRALVSTLAIGLVALLALGGCAADSGDAGPSPRARDALAVATAFTEARADRDIEQMSATSIEGFINGLVVLSLGQMPAEFAWQDAVGWTIEVERCEVTELDEATPTVRCDVSHTNTISEALDVGPYPGSYHIKVRFAGDEVLGTPITSTTVTESHQTEFPILDFTTQTWRPFVAWLEANHPDDVDAMLGSAVQPGVELMLVGGERNPLLSEDSILLWQQHTAEFAAELDDS